MKTGECNKTDATAESAARLCTVNKQGCASLHRNWVMLQDWRSCWECWKFVQRKETSVCSTTEKLGYVTLLTQLLRVLKVRAAQRNRCVEHYRETGVRNTTDATAASAASLCTAMKQGCVTRLISKSRNSAAACIAECQSFMQDLTLSANSDAQIYN
jgi:hypothetical protein